MAGDIRAHIRAFTLVEIVITIAVVSVFVASMAFMFYQIVSGLVFSSDNIKVLNLARLEMSKVNNLSYADATLADGYNNTTTNYENSAYDLNRTVNIVTGTGNDIKRVIVTAYPTGTTEQLVRLATYAADVNFGSGSGGGAPGSEDEADSFSLDSGEIKNKKLEKITIENTGGDEIVWTVVRITFTGDPGIELKKIKQDKTTLWSGTASSGDIVTLDSSLTMDAGTSYKKVKFEFSEDVSTATINYFEFQDGSQANNLGSGWSWVE